MDVKSTKNSSVSLLHYTVEFIQSSQKEILDVFFEFQDVKNISKDNLDDIIASINKLISGLNPIESTLKNPDCDNELKNSIYKWIDGAKSECNDLQSLLNSVQNEYKEMLLFFAESPALKSDQFFIILSDFAQLVEKCILENVKQKEDEEKERKREESNKTAPPKKGVPMGGMGMPGTGGGMGPSQGQLDMILQQMKKGNTFKQKRGSKSFDKPPVFN